MRLSVICKCTLDNRTVSDARPERSCRSPMIRRKTNGCVAIGAFALTIVSAGASAVRADFPVRSPIVEEGEIEYRHNGSITFDKNKAGQNKPPNHPPPPRARLTPVWAAGMGGTVHA